MTNLQETIRSITAQFGEIVLDDPQRLLGLLDDMGGFKEMDPSYRKALREQIRSGGVRHLLKPKKTKVKVAPVTSPSPKPAKPIGQKKPRRKLTDEQKTNIAVMIWCLLMLACLVTGVTGFWKLFAGTISYGGACWMIFPSIILGGLLWIFNEAF